MFYQDMLGKAVKYETSFEGKESTYKFTVSAVTCDNQGDLWLHGYDLNGNYHSVRMEDTTRIK